jgi:hypothetical protein
MRHHLVRLISVAAGILVAATPALAAIPDIRVAEPSSLTVFALGIGAAGLYKLLRRRR